MFRKRHVQYASSAIPELSGASGEVTVTLLNMPIHHSPSDNADYMVDNNLLPFIVEETFLGGVNFAKVKGIRGHSYHCFKCSKEIDISSKKPETFEFTLTFKKWPAFWVRITLPAAVCSSCFSLNAITTKGQDAEIVEAIESAFKSKGIQRKK